jgi:diazepam-binding inhibitor (GABA receptor modulating acyl-CoA-binding protein)
LPGIAVARIIGARLRWLAVILGSVASLVGQRVHDADQGNPVGNGVMDAGDQRRVSVGKFDEIEFPARARRVERFAGHLGDELLELVFAAGSGKQRVAKMAVDVEIGIVHPAGAVSVQRCDLPEAAIAQKALGEGALQARGVDTTDEDHHPDDLHQVFRPVHAQPRRIDVGHSLAHRHRSCSRRKWRSPIIASHSNSSSTGEISMSDLQAQFEAAVASSRTLSERPDNASLLKLYALYKQAVDGDVEGRRPGFADMVGRAKFDAWAAVKGTAADDAMSQYIALVEGLQAG